MSEKRAVILDALLPDDKGLKPVNDIICELLEQNGYDVLIFQLNELNLNHCIGCFGCWIKTPGVCIIHDDAQKIHKEIMQSDSVVLVTPVSFGGYSSQLKKIIDRLIPNILPHFNYYHDEIHHIPRYLHYPKLIAIGIQDNSDNHETNTFKLLVGRNAMNLKFPDYSVEVVSNKDSLNTIRNQIQNLFNRNDKWPLKEDILPLMSLTMPEISDINFESSGKALLIIGSPKTKKSSTSAVLGNTFLERLNIKGWETESLTLNKNIMEEKGHSHLLSAVDNADLIVFTFPLYIDALPFLVIKSLELIAAQRMALKNLSNKRIFIIVNSGFPESYQNSLALSICNNFAVKCGFTWCGALAMGSGEAICSGQPLNKGNSFSRPPGNHIVNALNIAGDAIAKTDPVPQSVQKLISKSPIPILPFSIWRWIFIKMGNLWWQKQSNENGVSKQDMLKRPYEVIRDS
ncbi:nadph-dependent fmn reductase [Candidatus Magnetomorum sp. HK-1]|nr:nadph-dependent fmn reductase [Candidatus Magnetomorum sp. HK-1]